MATYRSVYTSFWQDDFILTLSSTERYFYLYLMTNSKTSICGIYELPRSVAVMETGFPLSKVIELLEKFERKHCRIVCSKITNEIVIRNWLKYNNNQSPKVQQAIKSGLEAVKDRSLIQYTYSMDTVSYGIDTVSPSDDSVNDTVNDKSLSDLQEEPKQKNFRKPLVCEVEEYCLERKNNIDAESFVSFYESKGWMVGKNPMKDWKAAVRTWEQSRKQSNPGARVPPKGKYAR